MEPVEEVDRVGVGGETRKERDDKLMTVLSKNACTVAEIAEIMGVTKAGASTKLNSMVKRGFVERKIYKGKLHYYVLK